MAKTNRERIDDGLNLFRQALAPFVERELRATFRNDWLQSVRHGFSGRAHMHLGESISDWDTQAILAVMTKFWVEAFERTLGHAERSLIGEIWEVRKRHAHPTGRSAFSSPDTYRALDSMARLAEAVSAPEAILLRKGADEVLRIQFDEQTRFDRRKATRALTEGQPSENLKPWREIVTPHADVAKGNYQRAEFAADLWRVYQNPEETPGEYADPVEFFRRTFITSGLKTLLSSALQRLNGKGGDPITQLQTNFGGGKTHSMLALYHLCSGKPLNTLPGMEEILRETGIDAVPKVSRVVLVGTRISPGDPLVKEDGTAVRTLWGEIAWQLGGRKGYEVLRKADETATNPNDASLKRLLTDHGPVLILIDEWVAYARQLHEGPDLAGGSFETQFTFAQALTEVVSSIPNALMIVSLPASDTAFAGGSSPDESDLIEVGGRQGMAALRRLRNVINRKDSPWRAASQEESYEIVRRRLFNPITDPGLYRQRDAVVRAFCEMYANQPAEFPRDCRRADYEKRMQSAYPVHPELFDRLYTDWASLVKFQRTRGVLRLMAAAVHALWEGNDRSPLILPGHVAIDDPTVREELTRYLEDNWVPVIEKDVDGPNSLPLEIDRHNNNLGRYSAARRAARTIYLGSAPTVKAAKKGLDEQRVKLGCVQPGETAAVFSDALKNLTKRATFLYDDDGRYWFSTSPSLNRMAEDEAERLKGQEDKVFSEIQRRLGLDITPEKHRGAFAKIHLCPASPHDVPDENGTRLVIIGPEKRHQRKEQSDALKASIELLAKRSSTSRERPNTLIFLAADASRFDDLAQATRLFLAWQKLGTTDTDELTDTAKKQIASRVKEYDSAIVSRIAETWCWLLVPSKQLRSSDTHWQEMRLQGTGPLAARASAKLQSDAVMLEKIGPTVLRHHMDDVPMWRDDRLSVQELIAYFSAFLYLPKIATTKTLLEAIAEGVSLTSWEQEGFAYADAYDEATGRYQGLRVGTLPKIGEADQGILVNPSAARAQLDAEAKARAEDRDAPPGTVPSGNAASEGNGNQQGEERPPRRLDPTEFHGSVSLSATKLTPQVAKISEEIIQHLAAKLGVEIKITIDIQATLGTGFDADTVRTVTENSVALKFDHQGFEAPRSE